MSKKIGRNAHRRVTQVACVGGNSSPSMPTRRHAASCMQLPPFFVFPHTHPRFLTGRVLSVFHLHLKRGGLVPLRNDRFRKNKNVLPFSYDFRKISVDFGGK